MGDVIKTAWADVKFNNDFICIETFSGYRSAQRDPSGVQYLIDPEADENELGLALLDALMQSRFVLPEPRSDIWIHPEVTFDAGFYDYKLTSQRYAVWVSNLMGAYGYKNKRSLFQNMKSCGVERNSDNLIIRPMHHEKLDAWSGKGKSESDNLVVSSKSSPAEIGRALRLAMNRCT